MLCGIRSSNGVTRMSASTAVRSHYAKGGLTDRIAAALHDSGIDVANVTVDDLGPVDEFHTGGRAATVHLLSHLDLKPGQRVLDVGCGIGGTARHLVDQHDVIVSGIDLTDEFIETGKGLDRWVPRSARSFAISPPWWRAASLRRSKWWRSSHADTPWRSIGPIDHQATRSGIVGWHRQFLPRRSRHAAVQKSMPFCALMPAWNGCLISRISVTQSA